MNAQEFDNFWNAAYPDTPPISHLLKHAYNDRWFRIHSLPESKRYAENEEEWGILLYRQNTLFADLLGDNNEVLLVTGDYYYEGVLETDSVTEVASLTGIHFNRSTPINLDEVSPEQYDIGQYYIPAFSIQTWQPHKFDVILRDIANDNLRLFFISTANQCILAPYDGGVDIILKDSSTRDNYKEKYKDWLSDREDGL